MNHRTIKDARVLRMRVGVESIEVGFNEIRITSNYVMDGLPLRINPNEINWRLSDDNGKSTERTLKVESIIEFDRGISRETMLLKNVKIIK